MKKIIIITTVILLSCVSCSDNILDISPKDRISEDAVWGDENLIKAYHTNLYNCIRHGFNIHMQSKATDEAYCSISWGIGIIPLGNYNADNITTVATTDWTGGGNIYYWDVAWEYIRKINVFLENMQSDEISFEDKTRLVAEAKFLRAYLYFELIKRFGGVPIITGSYEMGADETLTRNTFDQCVDFIEQNLTEAIPDLPEKYATSDANFGRAMQDACQALRSRVYLYAASPLFNPSDDKEKWQKASDAAWALIEEDNYSLYPDYETLFNQPSGTENSEIIFARNFSSTNYHQAPMHNLGRRYGGYGGWWASNGPSQNLVDDYDMINGEPPFLEDGTINPASNYDPQHPYRNRDPRFEATIIHDSSVYHGDLHEMWISSDGESWGYDSYKESGDNPRTNYILRKFMPPEGRAISWQEHYTIPWIIFRLGEIYLNYAEAQFELGNEDVAREYLNRVRSRSSVDLPDIPASVTGDDLRQRIYNERRIELAFEEHRFWDVRRWKIAMEVENEPIYGMDIIKDVETGEKTYTPVKLLERNFEEHMVLLPIHSEEIRRTEMEQNSGY